MTKADISTLVARQRAYYATGATLPVKHRVDALKKLRAAVQARENELNEALRADLGKSASESYMCEVGMVLSELSYMIAHTARFARERRVASPWPSSTPAAS